MTTTTISSSSLMTMCAFARRSASCWRRTESRAVAFAPPASMSTRTSRTLPACLILDVELPDINGLDLQKQIAEGDHPPIVFITGHGDIPSSVRAIKHGAVDFLTKPFSDADLMRAVRTAVAQDRQAHAERAEIASSSSATSS